MVRIFINYRTEDEPLGAALVDHELSRSFGSDQVFRAAKSIPPGDDFADAILRAVRESAALLAVIGPRWLDATDDAGGRRLDRPDDWVRREIREALRHGVRVIPLLINVDLPKPEQLPGDIAALARCQYLRLHHRNSRHDISRLVGELTALVPGLSTATPPRQRRSRIVAGVATIAVLASVTAVTLEHRGGQPPASVSPTSQGQPAQGQPAASSMPGPRSGAALTDSPPVRRERTVILSTRTPRESVAVDDWRSVHDATGDLHVDANGLYTTTGAAIALLEGAAPATYERCARATGWGDRISFAALTVGAQVCARSTLDRYAALRVKSMPSPGDPRFIFYGRTWEHSG